MNYREVTKILSDHGCTFVRSGKGSHMVWKSPITGNKFPVANHGGKDIPRRTLEKIEKQSGIKLL